MLYSSQEVCALSSVFWSTAAVKAPSLMWMQLSLLLLLFVPPCTVQVDDADMRDLLHLSINSTSATIPRTAEDVVRASDSTAQLFPAEALELMRTAVERNHVDVLRRMLLRLVAFGFDDINHAQLLPMLERAIVLDANAGASSGDRLRDLCKLSAVGELLPDAVATLMHKALEPPLVTHRVWTSSSLRLLCQLPAAKGISAAQLSGIVEAAAAHGGLKSMQLLAAFPAFQQLQPAAAAAAVLAAVKASNVGGLALLLDARPAATGNDVLVPALVLAIGTRNARMLSALLVKASGKRRTFDHVANTTARFSADGLQQVLEAALKRNRMDIFKKLWSLPAAGSLQGKQLGQLLCCAAAAAPRPGCQGCSDTADIDVASTAGTGTDTLRQQFTDITVEQLVGLLRAAVQQQDGPTVAALFNCPAAAQLDTAVMCEMLLAVAAVPVYKEPGTNEEQRSA
jgi:hypothetical protein